MPQTPTALPPGTSVAGYSIERLIASGGTADVYLARDAAGHQVAIKLLPEDAAASKERRRRLVFEGRVLQGLQHTSICRIEALGESDGRVFLVMEYVDGTTLDVLATRERLPVPSVLDIGLQIAAALDHAHGQQIVHRDLKSANIMITGDGRVKVLDFGLARFASGSAGREVGRLRASEPGMLCGTAEFMSPEQALGRESDHRSDFFSLGVVLYELLTGVLPFSSNSRLHVLWSIVNAEPRPIGELNPDVPPELAVVVGRLLAKDRARRYQSAREVIEALKAVGSLRSRESAAAARRWFHRVAGWAAGVAVAASLMPGARVLAGFVDDAVDRLPLSEVTIWLGSDALHDFNLAAAPAHDPTVVWVAHDGRVAYTTRTRRGERALWLMPRNSRVPTIAVRHADLAAVSPDGRTVFYTTAGPDAGLYRTDWNGSDAAQLARGPIGSLVVASDGKAVAFTRRDRDGHRVWTVAAQGGTPALLSPIASPVTPLIAPGLDRIAMPLWGGVRICPLPQCQNPVTLRLRAAPVAWTPDGRALAHPGAPADANIWLTNVADGSMRQLTRFSGLSVTGIAWSADGHRLAVTRERTVTDFEMFNFGRVR